MLKDATVFVDAVRDTFDARACADDTDQGIVACPTREYTPGAFVNTRAVDWALFFWYVVKSEAAPRMIGIY